MDTDAGMFRLSENKGLREIQHLYGHSSVMTTENLGVENNLVDPGNDRLGLS